MKEHMITDPMFLEFAHKLQEDERSSGTIQNYLRHVKAFHAWAGEIAVTKELVTVWKDQLISQNYCFGTINTMLVSLNRFFEFLGWEECKVKTLRIQRRLFREDSKELNKAEYHRLLSTAQHLGKTRLMLLMETICATGIRVSEVKYITVEALRQRRTEIRLKGKIRTILIPEKLCRKLLQYCRKQKIFSGEVFLTRTGKGLTRKQIWAEMKAVCKEAKVDASKVFPHNLRHLFARTFYKVCHDVAKLADVLGHSSIETTRIYLISTGTEHAQTMARLGLVE